MEQRNLALASTTAHLRLEGDPHVLLDHLLVPATVHPKLEVSLGELGAVGLNPDAVDQN